MAVTPEDVRRVATLARLRLEPGDVEEMTRQLNSILAHVDELENVATDAVGDRDAPAGPERGDRTPLRPDDPAPDPLASRPEDMAPEWEDGFFTVPRLESHEQEDGSGDEPEEAADVRGPGAGS